MSAPDLLPLLLQRRSTPSRLLAPPGPDEASLWRILSAASRVPDHGKLTPWRFLLIRGDARQRLGELLLTTKLRTEPSLPSALADKERDRFNSAPVVVTVIGRILPGHRIPEQEQLLACGSVCFQILLAAEALDFGAQWLTGWAAYDPDIGRALGLGPEERVIGFIHLGSRDQPAPERQRPDLSELVSEWTGATPL